jgi:hypothetical protein
MNQHDDGRAPDEPSMLPMLRLPRHSHPAPLYRPPLTRLSLLDYWLFHGNADAPCVAIVRGENRLGYRVALHWLLTAAVLERTRVGAITVDGASDEVWRDVATWRRRVNDVLVEESSLSPWRDVYDRYEDGEKRAAERAFGALHRLCHDDPYGYRAMATPEQDRWRRRQLMVQDVRRHRLRRAIALSEPTIRPVSLSGIDVLNEPWRRGRAWGERVGRPLMLLIVTESRDRERLRVLRDHARWMAHFTEGFVLFCEPDGVDDGEDTPPADAIHIRISQHLPSWLPESTESGEPFALHARDAANPRPTFAMEIVDRGDGVFSSCHRPW